MPTRQTILVIPGCVKDSKNESLCLFVCLSVWQMCAVCLSVCVLGCFHLLRELYETGLNKPGMCGRPRLWSMNVFCRTRSRDSRDSRAAVEVVVCFWRRRGFVCLLCFVFFECARLAAGMRSPCLIYLSTSIEAVVFL